MSFPTLVPTSTQLKSLIANGDDAKVKEISKSGVVDVSFDCAVGMFGDLWIILVALKRVGGVRS